MGAFDFLGSLVNAGVSWFQGEENRNAQQLANQQSWEHAVWMDQNHISNVVADAKRSGINPLAALGVNTPSAPVAVGAVNDQIGNAGQALGRAVSALSDDDQKDAAMKRRLMELQIKSAEADVVGKQLDNSKNAVQLGQPGTPPGLPRGSYSIPLPRSRPGRGLLEYDPPTPLYQTFVDDKGDRVRLLGKEASQSLMNSASMPISVPIGAQMVVGNAIDLTGQHVRPDVMRHFFRGRHGRPPVSSSFVGVP